VQQIRYGVLSSEEFVAKTLERINKVDKTLHAFISINENALEQAKQIDKKLKGKEKLGACLGMPISIKTTFAQKGLKLLAHQKCLKNLLPHMMQLLFQN